MKKLTAKAWEKEQSFCERFLAGNYEKNVWKYVPKKLFEAVDAAFVDSDGYWIWLNEGYVAYDGGEDCGTIHEYNVSDLIEAIKTIRRGTR